MSAPRTAARIAGLLYLATFATSIPALALKTPYLAGTTHDPSAALWGAVLEIVLALSCMGTAVVLYPLIRRGGEFGALGFVASRTLEAALVMVGVMSVLALVELRSPDGASAAGDALIALHDAAFLLGPGLLPGVNALLLGSVLYRRRLVPRALPLIGMLGAPLLFASVLGTLFGVLDQVSPLAALAAAPIALWELSLGLWLTFRGIRAAGDLPGGGGVHADALGHRPTSRTADSAR